MLEGTEDKKKHMKDKKTIQRRYPFWDTSVLFLKDTVGNDVFEQQASSNPFGRKAFTFEDTVRMAQRASEEFGSWSNHECHEMKDMLMEMDVHNTGRVKLADFYSYSKDGAWQFLEPSEQLRLAGSLDESSSWLGPQVMIPNYITSMSNCITSAPYYSIWCFSSWSIALLLHKRVSQRSSVLLRAGHTWQMSLELIVIALMRSRAHTMGRFPSTVSSLHAGSTLSTHRSAH